jgi:hypothetical protein
MLKKVRALTNRLDTGKLYHAADVPQNLGQPCASSADRDRNVTMKIYTYLALKMSNTVVQLIGRLIT